MQTAVSDPKLKAVSGEQFDESSTSSMASSGAAVQPAFIHKRGRKRLDLPWGFKLAAAVSVSTLVAISFLIQA